MLEKLPNPEIALANVLGRSFEWPLRIGNGYVCNVIPRFLILLALSALPLPVRSVVSEDVLPTQAGWISAESQTKGSAFFRRIFQLDSLPVKAVLLAAADEKAELYINGRHAAEVMRFTNAITVDVTALIRSGTNVLAAHVRNASGQPAFQLMLELAFADGKQRWVVSDHPWLWSPIESPGWMDIGFPTVRWNSAVSHGAAGIQKWGNPFGATKSPDAYNSWMLAHNVNRATDPNTITALPGFKVEMLRSAEAGEDSWVAIAFDPQGRVTVAREKRGLLRMTLGKNEVEQVEIIDDTLLECRGLLYAYESLFVNANNSRGFYRLRDTDRDGKFDEHRLLLRTEGGVGHGRNHLALGPDGLIYMAHGDDVVLPSNLATNSPLQQMRDDQLLPGRDAKANQTPRRFAQVGHILQTDRDGSFFRLVAGGLRNPLDVAFNEEGEMFTYDADMERDLSAPWYQPTRVLHVVSGGDYGWRRSIPNIPNYAPDIVRAAVDIGVGSPTGVAFGTSSHFPEKYRRAFFIADWAYGRILAIHLRPDGASYRGAAEAFVSGRPLNLTDLTFGPDGAMYFITGGRGTKSGLYRVSYPGAKTESKEFATKSEEEARAALRKLRRKLEALQISSNSTEALPDIINQIWPALGHGDRSVRYAARVALEHQPVELWRNQVIGERNSRIHLTALLALARVSEDEAQDQLLSRLATLIPMVSSAEQLEIFRITALRLARFGKPTGSTAAALVTELERLYPAAEQAANRELCRLLCILDTPGVVAKTTGLLAGTQNSEDLLHFALCIASVQDGWTLERRRVFFDGLRRAEQDQGGSDYYGAIRSVRKQVVARLTAEETERLKDVIAPASAAVSTLGSPEPLPLVKEWRMEDFAGDLASRRRDVNAGRRVFHAAGCGLCHRVDGEGAVVGPDITAVGARFGRWDLLETILNPSKAIDEKYRNTSVTLKDGEAISGLMEREDDATLVLRRGLSGDAVMEIRKNEIATRRLSDVSPMPTGLLNVLTREQILDLLTFLENGPASRVSEDLRKEATER